MIGLLCFVLTVLASPFKSKVRLEAENAVLRHQLNVVRRRLPGRVRLTNHDRWFLIQLYRWLTLYAAYLPLELRLYFMNYMGQYVQLFRLLAREHNNANSLGFDS